MALYLLSVLHLQSCGGGAAPPAGIPAPVSSFITVTSPNPDGFVRVTGAAGSVPGGATVTAGNVTQGAIVKNFHSFFIRSARAEIQNSVVANSDGSFVISDIEADIGDTIRIRYELNAFTSEVTDKLVPDNVVLLSDSLVPQNLAYDSINNKVFVTSSSEGDGFIFIVDPDLNQLDLNSPLVFPGEENLQGIAVDSVSGNAVMVNPTSGRIIPFNATSFIPGNPSNLTGANSVVIHPVGGFALIGVQDSGNSLALYNIGAESIQDTLLLNNGTATHVRTPFIDIANDGSNFQVISISFFDDDSYIISKVQENGANLNAPSINVDLASAHNIGVPGSLAVFNNTNEVLISDTSNDQVHRLSLLGATTTLLATYDVGHNPGDIVINENSNMAYLVNTDDNSMTSINLNDDTTTSFLDSIGLAATLFAFDSGNEVGFLLSPFDHTLIIQSLP